MKNIFIAALTGETPNLTKFHHTGVGKINASTRTTELILKYKPSKIINYGTAGSLIKELSGIVKCTSFVQRDMDARGLMNFKLGETPFDKLSLIKFGKGGKTCGTGDNFVKKNIEIDCDVVDMEAYAIAKIAKIYKIKFECYKFISDYANNNSDKDWINNCKKGAFLFSKIYPECK